MTIRTIVLVLAAVAAGTSTAGPIDSSFTYQGVLTDAGALVNGTVDLRFSLWDAATGGAQVGPVSISNDVPVTDGRVTATVNVGPVMDGDELWLAIEVRDGDSTGAFTLLDPRQKLTATPYAAHSVTAGTAASADHATSADSATNAANATTATSALTAGHATTAGSASTAGDSDTLDGQHGAYYRAWSNLTGVPAGLGDGDDDTLADLSCAPGEVASWDGSAWVCSSTGGASYARTIIVGPVGDAAANGAALAAVLASTSPASAADAVLIRLEPGEYDVTGFNAMIRDFVSVAGSGRNITRIFAAACGPVIRRVLLLGNGELSDLTIENTCADPTAHIVGLDVGGILDGARVERVQVLLNGGTGHGVGVSNSSDGAFFKDVHVVVDGADYAIGIESYADDLYLIDCISEALAVTYGVGFNTYLDAKTVISRGYYVGSGSVVSQGLHAYGASVDAGDADFAGDDQAVSMYGTDGYQSGHFNRCGLHGQLQVGGDGVDDISVSVLQSRISHSGATVVLSPGVGTVRVAGSELAGDPVSGPVECVAVWDEGTGFFPGTCP